MKHQVMHCYTHACLSSRWHTHTPDIMTADITHTLDAPLTLHIPHHQTSHTYLSYHQTFLNTPYIHQLLHQKVLHILHRQHTHLLHCYSVQPTPVRARKPLSKIDMQEFIHREKGRNSCVWLTPLKLPPSPPTPKNIFIKICVQYLI